MICQHGLFPGKLKWIIPPSTGTQETCTAIRFLENCDFEKNVCSHLTSAEMSNLYAVVCLKNYAVVTY